MGKILINGQLHKIKYGCCCEAAKDKNYSSIITLYDFKIND